jgi:hypothetical protein
MRLDPLQSLPSTRQLLNLAGTAMALKEQAHNEHLTATSEAVRNATQDAFDLHSAEQFAYEALAWVQCVKSDNARRIRERQAVA